MNIDLNVTLHFSCGEGEIDESTTGHLRDLLLASLAAVKDPELNIAVLRKRCSLLSQFNRCPSLESPTFQDDTRTFVNKLKNNDMIDRSGHYISQFLILERNQSFLSSNLSTLVHNV